MTESDKVLIEDFMYRIQQGTVIIEQAIEDMDNFVLQDMNTDDDQNAKFDMDVIQANMQNIHNSTEVIQSELLKGSK